MSFKCLLATTIGFAMVTLGYGQVSYALETLSDSSNSSMNTMAQAPRSGPPGFRAIQSKTQSVTPVEVIETENVNDVSNQTVSSQTAPRRMQTLESNLSVIEMPSDFTADAERLGTGYFQRPLEGRGSVRVMPSINSTLANAGSGENGEAQSLDINADALETRAAFGLTKWITLEARFSYGVDTVKVGSQTSKRSGLSDFNFKATRLIEENDHDLFYGAELGISPGRAAIASGGSSGANRYSGGTQLTPFIGFQAESIYGFNFGGQGSFTFRTTRFFDDGTDKSGGHLITAEGFIEQDYDPATLGLNAALTQKLDDNRDQTAVLVPQTALGLGGYADFEVNSQLFIPVQINYTMGLSNTAGRVNYSKIDRISIAAGASYYF
ncbi:MAG: hypothetical protein ACK5WZ_03435 [Pseudobdellovibrionaceae bacterium]